MKKNRGMILICTLAIMVILSIFLLTAVYQMQSTTMVTKKMMWDIKAFWAAEAGNTIASDGCILTKYFPYSSVFISYNKEKKYGGYIVKRESSLVKGEDESSASSFTTYYKNFLPASSYCFYNASTTNLEDALKTHFDNIKVKTYSQKNENDANFNLPQGEIYCLTVGKSGPSICGLEFVYGLNDNINKVGNSITQENVNRNQATTVSAAVYVGNNLKAFPKDSFSVLQEGGTRGSIVAGNEVVIKKSGSNNEPTWYDTGALKIDEGAIFAKKVQLNTKNIPIDDNSNLVNYGVSIYSSPDVKVSIPNLEEEKKTNLPSGTFCFIEMPSKNDFKQYEFNNLCSSLLEISLSPSQFKNIYQDNINKIKENESMKNYIGTYFQSLQNTIQNYNERYNCKEILKYNLDEKLKSSNLDNFEENLYRLYMTEQINTMMTSYRQIKNGEESQNTYESYFIPDGNFKIDSSLYGYTSLTYSDIIKARIYGNILDKIHNENAKIGTGFTQYAMHYGENYSTETSLKQPSKLEKQTILQNIQNLQNPSERYITEKITQEGSTCYVISKLSDHNIKDNTSQIKKDISNLMKSKAIGFDTKDELTMSLHGNLKTDGFFNFATFERYPYDPSETYLSSLKSRYTEEELNKYISNNYEHYTSAMNRRASIKLGDINSTKNDTSIIANSINIKGSIHGKGHVSSKKGDINFEAYGSGVDGVNSEEENWVSIWSMHDINIKTVSAYKSSAYGSASKLTTSNFNGILYSKNDIYISVYDNINFSLSGVIICGHNLDVYGLQNFSVKYDPRLSNIVISKFVKGWQTLTEELNAKSNGNKTTSSNNSTISTGRFKAFNRI